MSVRFGAVEQEEVMLKSGPPPGTRSNALPSVDIWSLLPLEGFLHDYVRYTVTTDDAPATFHLGAILAVFSSNMAGVNLRVTLLEGGPETPPQTCDVPLRLWVMLVGASGVRKSSCAHRALRLYRGELGPTSGTPSAMYAWLAQHPRALFCFNEFSQATSALSAGTWCDFYDSPKQYKHQNERLTVEINMPRVTMLTCSNLYKKLDWTDGLCGRMLVLGGKRETFNVFPWSDSGYETKLVRQLDEIGEACSDAEVTLSRKAFEAYVSWSSAWNVCNVQEAPELKRNPLVPLALGRVPAHVLRVAGLYALSKMYTEVLLDDMERAIALGEFSKQCIFAMEGVRC